MLSRLAISAALVAVAAPAFAGGFSPVVTPVAPAVPVAVAPVAAPASDWTGFYAGGQLGYGDLSIDMTDGDESLEIANGSGALFGAHAGYMRDFGRIVLGAELDWDFTSIDLEGASELEGEGSFGSIDSIARAKVRLGYDAGRFLPYVTAGVARAGLSYDDAEAEALFDDMVGGRFVGLGVVYVVNDRFTVGLEALRHDFDGPDVSGNSGGLSLETQVDTISLRGSWRF